jgi:hypothetical protein
MTQKFILASILCMLLAAPIASAQNDTGAAGQKVLGTVVNGNTTVEFESARLANEQKKQLQAWGDFAAAHPQLARAIGHNPKLVSSDDYVNKHAELAKLFSDNPGMREQIVANPGNFVVPTSKTGE